MDGKQFLKEAKEAYSENYQVNFANFTVDEFKRSICHGIDRSGTAINFLVALLRQKTREDHKKYPDLMLHPERQADVDNALKRAKEETDSYEDELQCQFELLVEVVLKYLDEISGALKEHAEDRAAFKSLYAELGKLPSVIGDGRLGPMVDDMVRKYCDVVNARHDLSVYNKMRDVSKGLRGKKDDLASLLADAIKDATSRVSDVVSSYNGIEKQILGVLAGCLKGKYVFWKGVDDDGNWSKIIRIDAVTLDKYGHDGLCLHGPCVAPLEWEFGDKCKYVDGRYWSRLTDLSKGLSKLCIVEWEELLEYVEKHAPFAMELIMQLEKDYKLK